MSKLIVPVAVLAVVMSPALAQVNPPRSEGTPVRAPAGMGPGMMMGPMMGMMCPGGAHTEGRLAFLKAELRITDAQETAWNAYADAVRAIDQKAASRSGVRGGPGRAAMGGPGMMAGPGCGVMGRGPGMMGGWMMMQQGGRRMPAPEALEQRVQLMEACLSDVKDLQAATAKLYSALDEKQKTTADELLGMPCCRRAM